MRRIPMLLFAAACLLIAESGSALAAAGTSPVNTKQPDPSGKAEVGQKISVDNGKWSGQAPITFTYQWQSCTTTNAACTDIAGATAKNYTVVAAQMGSTLRATVTATNPAGQASAFSNLTSAVISAGPGATSPVNTSLPMITGSLLVGQTIQASTGAWTGLTSNGFGYQWSRCNTDGTSCASISGATGQSYGLGQIDLGTGIRVSVTATNHKGSTTAVSNSSLIARSVVLTARFSGELRAGQETTRPRGTSSGTIGHFTARLKGKTLRWALTFSHLTGRPTVTGLNKGLRMSNGPAFKTLCRHCYSPTHGTLTLTSSQVDAMLRGQTYVNIHTVRNSIGEVRGQISRLS
jgi:CHRD domain